MDSGLTGDSDANVIKGLVGNDTLTGGLGDDIFVYDLSIDNGNDTILDYNFPEGDIIALQNAGGITMNDLDVVLDLTINAGGFVASLLQNDLVTSAGTITFDNLAPVAGTIIQFSLNPEFTVILGTNGNDTLVGTALDNIIYGFDGSDILQGGSGDDVLKGGLGDDEFRIFDTSFIKVDGGGGTDTLVWDSFTTLDLTAIEDSKVDSIEEIDLLSNTGDLVLDLTEVLDLTDVSNDVVDGANKLIIRGDADNTVTLVGAWAETALGSNIYANGAAEVHIVNTSTDVLVVFI